MSLKSLEVSSVGVRVSLDDSKHPAFLILDESALGALVEPNLPESVSNEQGVFD